MKNSNLVFVDRGILRELKKERTKGHYAFKSTLYRNYEEFIKKEHTDIDEL